MACSPVLVDNLPKEEPNSLKEEPIVTVKGPNSIEVSFSPVAYATSYGYKINDEEIIIAPQPSFIDGKYVFSIFHRREIRVLNLRYTGRRHRRNNNLCRKQYQ